MVYQEALINKTECNNHDFCKVVVLDVVTMMMVLMKIFVSWFKFARSYMTRKQSIFLILT